MDIYRILRISIYLLIMVGSISIYFAQGNPYFFLASVGCALLSYHCVDSGRIKPVRMSFFVAMTFALLVFHLMPLREYRGYETHFPIVFAHFLCSFQLLLLFTAYRAPMLLVYFGSTLVIVLISGIVEHSPNLLLRMSFFVGISAWTFYIHSLWQSRESFNTRALKLAAAPNAPEAERSGRLPKQAVAQGMAFTMLMSLACLALAFFLFFSTPRLNDTLMGWLQNLRDRRDDDVDNPDSVLRPGGGGDHVQHWSESVNLRDLGPIRQNRGLALSMTVSTPASKFTDSLGRVFLRGMAYSEQYRGNWKVTPSSERQVTSNPSPSAFKLRDPSIDESASVLDQPEILQRIKPFHSSTVYFGITPISQLRVRSVLTIETDSEGLIRRPDKLTVGEYDVYSHLPIHENSLPDNAVAQHKEKTRYVRDTGLNADVEERVREHAKMVTALAANDLQRVHSIVSYLRDNHRFNYTLNLEAPPPGVDPIARFILSEDENYRRGHCGYFASAFVVLCRLNNIPARLATGFCTIPQADTLKQGGTIQFKNSEAHAWGEVYFKDIGWVIFDPTPPAVDEKQPSLALNPGATGALPAPMPLAQRESVIEKTWGGILRYDGNQQRTLYDRLNVGMGGAGAVLNGDSGGGWLLAGIVWAGLIWLLWFVQSWLRKGIGRVGSTPRAAGSRARAVLHFYNDLLHTLSRRGFVRKPGQTPREFSTYVVRQGGAAFQPVLVVTEAFEKVRYGGDDLSQEEFNSLQEALDKLRELTFGAGTAGATPKN